MERLSSGRQTSCRRYIRGSKNETSCMVNLLNRLNSSESRSATSGHSDSPWKHFTTASTPELEFTKLNSLNSINWIELGRTGFSLFLSISFSHFVLWFQESENQNLLSRNFLASNHKRWTVCFQPNKIPLIKQPNPIEFFGLLLD